MVIAGHDVSFSGLPQNRQDKTGGKCFDGSITFSILALLPDRLYV